MFSSSAELHDHLQSEHIITKAQIQTLLDVCESSVKDIRTKCPIFLEKRPYKKGLGNHLSSHLERFATFSIPRAIFSGDEPESRAKSDSEKVQGLRSDISTESFSLSFQSPPVSTTSHTNNDLDDEMRLESEEIRIAVENRKRVLGHEHPDTLTFMAVLASKYQSQGRLEEAEDLDVQVMETRKRVLGPEHPDTLTSMADLASTYRSQSRLEEAGELHVQAMEARKRVLGLEHPDTLTSMAGLASTYRSQGRLEEAGELHVQAMEARKRVLGPGHPDTLTSMADLASIYRSQGRLEEAEELNVQIIETRKTDLRSKYRSLDTLPLELVEAFQKAKKLMLEQTGSFRKIP